MSTLLRNNFVRFPKSLGIRTLRSTMSQAAVNGANGVNGVNGHRHDAAELWRHPRPETTQLHAFQQHLFTKYPIASESYHDLWQWSIDNPAAFWEEVWHYTGVKAHKKYDSVR